MFCKICGCPTDRWLRTTTVARHFGATPKRVRRMIKSGQIDAVMFGGEWRIDHESLDEMIKRESVRHV